MNYSEEQLRQIQAYGSIFLKISDIAVAIDVPIDVLREDIRDCSHPASMAYRRGKLITKIKINSQETKLAQIGSPLALDTCRRNLLDMEDDE